MSKMDRYGLVICFLGLLWISIVNTVTNHNQQKVSDKVGKIVSLMVELDQIQETKLWDLHDRVLALEAEDERLSAHIKWFVMRRSGTDELRKMEAAIKKLEGVERAGD